MNMISTVITKKDLIIKTNQKQIKNELKSNPNKSFIYYTKYNSSKFKNERWKGENRRLNVRKRTIVYRTK